MKILIADDDPAELFKLEDFLVEWGYEVVSVSNGNDVWGALSTKNPPRLLLLDWMMPGMDGLEVCRKIREQAREPYAYILMLTSKTSKEDLVKGMDAGADDYITKPYNWAELKVRLRAGHRIVKLNEELLKTRNNFKLQASLDPLTGTLNRRAINNELKRAMARSCRDGKSFALVMLDVDHFKETNDKYGHLAGDQVLCEIVNRLNSTMRSYEFIGRYGGEEFLLILQGCDCEKKAIIQAERLRKFIFEKPVNTSEGMIKISASFGIAMFNSNKEMEIKSLIKQADDALYLAKERGRNRVEINKNL